MNSTNPLYSVLFVCTANLVRSPMAEALFSRMLEADGVRADWRVESAGTWARPGKKVPPETLKVMAEQQIDLSGHRSRVVSAEMLREFSLILVMEPGHKEALMVEFPEVSARVYLLTEMAGKRNAVEDPAGGTPEEYMFTAAELKDLLAKGRARIEILAGKT
jgi:protein-tyrosine-phosphatase